MAELFDLLTNATNNIARFPEGQTGPTVNDGARELEAMIARTYRDQSYQITTAGSATAYTVATFRTLTQLSDIGELKVLAHVANTGAATLQVNALTAKPIVKTDGTNLQAGDIIQHQPLNLVYSPGLDKFVLQGAE